MNAEDLAATRLDHENEGRDGIMFDENRMLSIGGGLD